MEIGRWQVDWVTDGEWRLDGGAMFGRVPRTLWEQVASPDERNRVRLTCRVLVLRSDDGCVLVDSGLGPALPTKLAEYVSARPTWGLPAGLESLGVETDKVAYVILSHLHFDHVGGCVMPGPHGALVPTFPNARHLVQRREWEDAFDDNVLLRRSYVTEMLAPLENAGVIEFLAGSGVGWNRRVLPGLTVEVTGGHCAAHQIVRLSDGRDTVAYLGDLLALAPHVNPAWVLAFDTHPLDTVAAKQRLFERAEQERWLIVLDHDPEHACGHIIRDDKGQWAWRDAG